MKTKKRKSKTIKFAELQRMSFCNSPKMPQAVNINGERLEWVGIGWINVGAATGKEVVVID